MTQRVLALGGRTRVFPSPEAAYAARVRELDPLGVRHRILKGISVREDQIALALDDGRVLILGVATDGTVLAEFGQLVLGEVRDAPQAMDLEWSPGRIARWDLSAVTASWPGKTVSALYPSDGRCRIMFARDGAFLIGGILVDRASDAAPPSWILHVGADD